MGLSTDGQLCYGVKFDEDFEFPWGDGDVDDWWLEVNGYAPSKPLYNSDGEYINGVRPSDAMVKEYFAEREAFREKIGKLPFELVNYCSGDYPSYILGIPSTSKTANRGYPIILHEENFRVNGDDREALLAFCDKYDIKYSPEDIGWWLSSYMG